jgi:hypothetical protein
MCSQQRQEREPRLILPPMAIPRDLHQGHQHRIPRAHHQHSTRGAPGLRKPRHSSCGPEHTTRHPGRTPASVDREDRTSDSPNDSPDALPHPQSSAAGSGVASSMQPSTQLRRACTRSQCRVFRPLQCTYGTVRYGGFASTGEPENLSEALQNNDWKMLWIVSIVHL